jgi:hypothetical protein
MGHAPMPTHVYRVHAYMPRYVEHGYAHMPTVCNMGHAPHMPKYVVHKTARRGTLQPAPSPSSVAELPSNCSLGYEVTPTAGRAVTAMTPGLFRPALASSILLGSRSGQILAQARLLLGRQLPWEHDVKLDPQIPA